MASQVVIVNWSRMSFEVLDVSASTSFHAMENVFEGPTI